ncbi:MAG TPA: hypothetical protein VKB46_03405 [Pyrinomonadaceae bacterium]|nr:hypothetical protein [Pyrinomonadaceae bacterium]
MKTSRAILMIALLISLANWNASMAMRKLLRVESVSRTVPRTSRGGLQPSAKSSVAVARTPAPLPSTDVGPGLGFVEGLSGYLIDPGNPSDILASTGITVFKSNNAGTSWHPAGVGLEANGYLAVVPNIRSDPSNPHTVYAVGDSGLFRSTDFGEHWTRLSDSFGLRDVAVSPTSPDTLFVVSVNSVYLSTDGGITLVRQGANGLPDFGGYTNVVFSPADPQTLYVVDYFSGVYKSTDAGATFNLLINSPIAPGQVFPHPTLRDTFFLETLGESTGLFRSTDGGTTFHQVTGGLPAGTVQFVTFDVTDPLTLYASADEGLLRSTDGGITFKALGIAPDQLGAGEGGAVTLSIDPANAKVLYVNTAKGNFKSTNRGRSFTEINDGFRAAHVIDVEFDGERNTGLYVVANHALFRSRDRGKSYTEIKVPPRIAVTAVGIPKTEPNTIVIATFENGILRSTNGGRTWTNSSINTGQTGFFESTRIVIDPGDAHNVYVVSNQFYRSTDGGQNFSTDTAQGLESLTSTLTIDPEQPNVLFLSGGNGLVGPPLLIKSSNGGISFTPALVTLGIVNGVVVDPHNSNIVYVTGVLQLEADEPYPLVTYGAAKSLDGGATFTPSDSGLPHSPIRGLVTDPLDSARLFTWVAGQGLFTTQDGAVSWSRVNDTETVRRSVLADALAINPQNPKLVYLGGASLLEVAAR